MNQEDFAIAVSKAFEGGFVKFISATCLVGGLIPAELSAGLVEPLPVAHISRHPAGGVGVVGLLQHAHCISTLSIDPLILVDCVTFLIIVNIQTLGPRNLQTQVVNCGEPVQLRAQRGVGHHVAQSLGGDVAPPACLLV